MMLRVRWLKVLRELGGNKARSVLVVLSIAVGVFAVGVIANSWAVLVNDLNTAYLATNPASAVLTLEPFGDDLISAVESRREIAQAEGRRSLVVKMQTPGGLVMNLSLDAVPDFEALAISRFTPEGGAWPPARRELLVERSWAEPLGLTEGQTIAIELPDGRDYDLKLAGFVHDLHRPPAGNVETAYGYISMDTLQWLGEERTYNQLYITVAENPLDEGYIQQAVTDLKEDVIERNGYTVISTTIPKPGEAFLTVIINAFLLVLSVVGAFSLLLSGALVVNTVSAIVTRQVRQIGVMKAIGATRPQIMEIYLASVAVYGLLSLGIAVPLAAAGTRAFTTFFARMGNFDILTTDLPPAVVALQAAVGLIVPLAAASIPVTLGVRITVREAISDYGLAGEGTGRTLLDRLAAGVRGVPTALALSLRNTFRRKARLGLTLSTLTLAGAIFVAVLSVRDSLFASFERALVYYQYDLSVDMGAAYRVSQLEREARRVPGVGAVEGWLQRSASRVRADESESANYTLIGVPADSPFLSPELVAGRWVQPGDRYKVVVNTDFLREEPDVAIGDRLVLRIGGEEDEWEVVGIATKQYSQPVIYTGVDDLGRVLGERGRANRVVIRLEGSGPALQAEVARMLEERFKRAGLLVGATTTRSDFVETFSMRFNFLIIFLLLLAGLLAFVGGLGLAGTMGLNVLERVREIGVMRAIGASDRAVQRIVLSEGMLIGMLSWLLATAAAVPLSRLLSDGVGVAFGGEPLAFSFSVVGVAVWLGLVIAIAALSSAAPARRASRLSVQEVLGYE